MSTTPPTHQDASRPISPLSTPHTLVDSPTTTHADLEKASPGTTGVNSNSPFDVSPARRYILLAVFSLATALDTVNVSALLTTTESISVDLGLEKGNITWM